MNQVITDQKALDLIHGILDGEEWDSSTLEDVARVIENTGRHIRPPDSNSGAGARD